MSMPSPISVTSNDDNPAETSGSGTPVIGRVQNGALWLDVRAIDDADALCASLDGL